MKKSIAITLATACLGITAALMPTAAMATIKPPPGGGGVNCAPYVTAISVNGSTLSMTYKIQCSASLFEVDTDWSSQEHNYGGEKDYVCKEQDCTISYQVKSLKYPKDEYCAAGVSIVAGMKGTPGGVDEGLCT